MGTETVRGRFPNFPGSPAYLLSQWPRALSYLERLSFNRTYTANDFLRLLHWAGLSSPKRLRAIGIPKNAIHHFASMAAADRHSTQYHQSGHFVHAIIAAGLLAKAGGLNRQDTDLLIIAALVHDLDHLGRLRRKGMYQQEKWSADLVRFALGRHRGNLVVACRLTGLLLATSFSDDPLRDRILASDPLASYLVDADLFASLFYRRGLATRLTRHLKLEERDTTALPILVDRFTETARQRGFYTEAAVVLHEALKDHYSLIHPKRPA